MLGGGESIRDIAKMTEPAAGYCEITLEPKLASIAAPGLYAQLSAHRADTLVLNASKVEQIGVLCMQILVAACQTWRDEGKDFEIVEPSEVFCKSTETVGLPLSLLGAEEIGSKPDDDEDLSR